MCINGWYLDEGFFCSVKGRAAQIKKPQITAMQAAHKILSCILYKMVKQQYTSFPNIDVTGTTGNRKLVIVHPIDKLRMTNGLGVWCILSKLYSEDTKMKTGEKWIKFCLRPPNLYEMCQTCRTWQSYNHEHVVWWQELTAQSNRWSQSGYKEIAESYFT